MHKCIYFYIIESYLYVNVVFVYIGLYRFTNAGIRHVDLFFPDGTCPSEDIMKNFLQIVTETKGAVAVHCKVYYICMRI